MAKEQGTKPIAQNKKARHDYAIEDKYEAGLVLTGTEVKSLREGRASLAESFITIDRRGEMWLEGANIPEYLNGTWNNHAPKRKRPRQGRDRARPRQEGIRQAPVASRGAGQARGAASHAIRQQAGAINRKNSGFT